jgi:phosphoribosylformimino-5-aminoimidazole carboxamide ribotide isomerase
MDGIAATGLNIWLDAGISDGKFAAEIADFAPMGTPLAGVIVGLETLQRPTELVKIATTIGAERAIFSLDLRNGTPNTQVPTWQNADPMQIITAAVEAGFHRVVVLDLARVGTGRGVATLPLCQKIKRRWPDIAVFTGGGVRAAHDLQAVAESGCDGVLVASAIHDGSWPFANATSW